MRSFSYALCLLVLTLFSCEQPKPATDVNPPVSDNYLVEEYIDTTLNDSLLYNKIFGFLLGSAIGDAMGAPTEMWSKEGIQIEYGFVDSLDVVFREASPEGPWEYNLPPGGTTDDTRWKEITIQFLEETEATRSRKQKPDLNAKAFAEFLVERYLEGIEQLKATDSFDPEPFEINARKMTWLQEWALVAKPYAENDLDGYANALTHFYGGEMACAGMLYAPTIGAFYPGKPELAYQETYKLSLFDLGYARDLSSLLAAMTAAAMESNPSRKTLNNIVRDVDPEDFFKSRLIGRTAHRFFKTAKNIVREAEQLEQFPEDKNWKIPVDYPYDSLYFAQTQLTYERLDNFLQDIPFHAGEIYLISITSMLFSDYDFQKTMEFITNYGRDNDTIGAVCGAILGAYWGADRLPKHLVDQVLKTNKAELGIDLEALAQQFTASILSRKEKI